MYRQEGQLYVHSNHFHTWMHSCWMNVNDQKIFLPSCWCYFFMRFVPDSFHGCLRVFQKSTLLNKYYKLGRWKERCTHLAHIHMWCVSAWLRHLASISCFPITALCVLKLLLEDEYCPWWMLTKIQLQLTLSFREQAPASEGCNSTYFKIRTQEIGGKNNKTRHSRGNATLASMLFCFRYEYILCIDVWLE